MIDLTKMVAELVRDEGTKLVVYDDATGLPIGPGTKVIGHPTIGTGRALDSSHGITIDERNYLLQNDISGILTSLDRLGWYGGMPNDRARAVVNMAFQLGVSGMESFSGMVAAIKAGQWTAAADAAMASRWAAQTPARARRVTTLLESGDGPPAPAAGVA